MKDKFLEFAKTPLGTAIAIGLYCVVLAIYLFSKTSLGKKSLFIIKERVSFLTDKFKEHQEETSKELKLQRDFYEEKLALQEAKHNKFKEFVLSSLKYINNKKLKESIENFELSEIPNEHENNAE